MKRFVYAAVLMIVSYSLGYFSATAVSTKTDSFQHDESEISSNSSPQVLPVSKIEAIALVESPLDIESNAIEADLSKSKPIGLYADKDKQLLLGEQSGLGDYILIDETDPNWLKLQSKVGATVWVHNTMIQAVAGTGKVIGNNVNIRYSPVVSKHNVVGRLNRGTILQLNGDEGDWFSFIYPATFNVWATKEDVAKAEL